MAPFSSYIIILGTFSIPVEVKSESTASTSQSMSQLMTIDGDDYFWATPLPPSLNSRIKAKQPPAHQRVVVIE